MNMELLLRFVTFLSIAFLAACGGSGGGTPGSFRVFELVDPTPGTGNFFGAQVVFLANGNIVVTDPGDSSVANGNSAVHLYSAGIPRLIASLYGDNASDRLGSGGIVELPNGNFVIVSTPDEVNGVIDAGSVRLVNGTNGQPIGSAITGDDPGDSLGSHGVVALSNGNFVIVSPNDEVNGVIGAGSVRLVNGTNGQPIGSAIAGDNVGDALGLNGVVALPNGNFVIVSANDQVNGVIQAGSVQLVNGTNGQPIGSPIAGNDPGDSLGSQGVVALPNGNFVIVSAYDQVNGVIQAGSVRLVNGTNGEPIGDPIAGSVAGDLMFSKVAVSASGYAFVLGMPVTDNNGLIDSGRARLVVY